MSTNRGLLLAVLGVLAVSAAVTWLVICPNYREMSALKARIAQLNVKIDSLGNDRLAVRNLAEQVEQARQRSETQLKVIPEVPDVADLIRKLSLPVDGVTVVDQTFTAGTPNDLDLGKNGTIRSMPLTVEMAATFESVFALMRASESMNRLLRVSSVKVAAKRDSKDAVDEGVPVLDASLGLEAMYAPAVSDSNEEVR